MDYLYEVKESILTKTEKEFFAGIREVLPNEYILQPQVNLASILKKNEYTKTYTDLYRNIDFCVFDQNYKPIFLIEINDDTHDQKSRQARDIKVQHICEEAGIPLVKFWTKYGVKQDYIQKRINEALEQSKNPVRIKHSKDKSQTLQQPSQSLNNIPYGVPTNSTTPKKSSGGCYVATAVYGSYDCAEVWVLRRYRDLRLSKSIFGRLFIKVYYAISPTLVKWFGRKSWFQSLAQKRLDKMVNDLKAQGFSDKPYRD